jgi:general secretion pathway protein G
MTLRVTAKRTRRAAFTLLEMLVVVAIIVALAGVGTYFLFGAMRSSEKDIARIKCKALGDVCVQYSIKNHNFPQSLQQLLQRDPKGNGPYLEEPDALLDPWGNQFQYNPQGQHNMGRRPDVFCQAPDGTTVGNWPEGQ